MLRVQFLIRVRKTGWEREFFSDLKFFEEDQQNKQTDHLPVVEQMRSCVNSLFIIHDSERSGYEFRLTISDLVRFDERE